MDSGLSTTPVAGDLLSGFRASFSNSVEGLLFLRCLLIQHSKDRDLNDRDLKGNREDTERPKRVLKEGLSVKRGGMG